MHHFLTIKQTIYWFGLAAALCAPVSALSGDFEGYWAAQEEVGVERTEERRAEEQPAVHEFFADGRLTGRVEREFSATGLLDREVHRTFNAAGEVGVVETTRFNSAGAAIEQRLEVTDPMVAMHLMTFEPFSMSSKSVTWEYDAAGRMTREVTVIVDGPTLVRAWEYDELGREIRYDDQGRTLSTEYDELGNVIREVSTYPESDGLGGYERVVEREFEGDRLLRERSFDSRGDLERETTNSYDGQGRLVLSRQTALNIEEIEYRYIPSGQVRITRSNFDLTGDWDRVRVEVFNSEGVRLLHQEDQPFDGVVDWYETFSFDEAGRAIRHLAQSRDEVFHDTTWTRENDGTVVISSRAGWRPSIETSRIDESGNEFLIELTALDGTPLERTSRVFNSEGLMTEETREVFDPVLHLH